MEKTVLKVANDLGYVTELHEVTKNNITKQGIRIIIPNSIVSPVIYFDSFSGLTTENEVKERFLDLMETIDNGMEYQKDFNELTKEKILNNCVLCIQAVGTEKIVKFYNDNFSDLEIYSRYLVDENASCKITYELLEKFNISESELFESALNNMKKDMLVANMSDFLFGMDDDTFPFYVVTNNRKTYGASYILLDEVQDKLKNLLNTENLLILPSSIHEVLVLNADDNNVMELLEVVKAVNNTEVTAEEKLSDNVYQI